MTDAARADREAELRAAARTDPDAGPVLADFYEEQGQPTRAKMWRKDTARTIHDPIAGASTLPPDLVAVAKVTPWCKIDPRRNLMMWLLSHVVNAAEVARQFNLSANRVHQILTKQWREIGNRSSREAKRPTMPATARLVAADALRAYQYVQYGDVPPVTWPATRKHEIERLRQRADKQAKPTKTKDRP